ncbi:MAG: transglycosylase SLT domain-containing protein [Prevotella sp.]|nr:transglycosylase SLT domain-containing protein [Prevotella sp.]
MKRLAKFVFISMMFFMSMPTMMFAEGEENDYDWTPVIDAIIQVESKGNPNARSGIYCGILQISPVLVQECNNILKRRGSSKRYTLNDRFNVTKSKEMFVIIQSYYNPKHNVERAIRMWQGGCNYNVRSTQRYYDRVMSYMR